MDPSNIATQTMYAELTQRALDAQFDEFYDEQGSFSMTAKKTDKEQAGKKALSKEDSE